MEKRFAPQYLKVKDVNRDEYTIRFVFSSGAVDRHGEVIDQKGWMLENYLKNPVVLWGHDQSKFPIAKAANMQIVNDTLEGDVIFAYNENPEAAIAFELCAGGFLNAGSVGFMNIKWMYDENLDLLTLLENELFEFSIVNVPANPEALAKAIDGLKAKNVDKTVIANIQKFQETAKKNAADRFKNLGEEVKDGEDDDDIVEVPKEDPEELDEEVAVKAALEVLFKAGREVIGESVKELTSRLNDSDENINNEKVDSSHPAEGLKKGLSNARINFLIRSLMKGKS
jgi:HK97 family phage prohead protease